MHRITAALLLITVLVLGTALKTNDFKQAHSIEGTWELESIYNYNSEGLVDTVEIEQGYRQVKMYIDGKIMWSRYIPNNTIGRYGYGSYNLTDVELTESIEYGDAEMMEAIDTVRVFSFRLNLKENSFSQTSVNILGHKTFSENYKRVK